MTNQTIKVGVLPGAIVEYLVEEGTTVAQALEMAQLSSEGYDVRLDGDNVELETVIPTTAKVLVLVKKIKGNVSIIKIGVLPGAIVNYSYEEVMTVKEALDIAGLNPEGYDIRLDGNNVNLDDMADGQVLILVKKIKGNK